jgi:transposase
MKKDPKKVNSFIKMNQSKKPKQSKNALAQQLSEKFGVGLSTAKRWITDYDKEQSPDLKVVKTINRRKAKDKKKNDDADATDEEIDDLSDEQIYDEIKRRLLRISRTAPWEKDVIAASKELVKLMASAEYKKAKEKKKKKPTMKEVGVVLSSLLLGVNTDTIEEFKKVKKASNE